MLNSPPAQALGPNVFVLPAYAVAQLDNARRTARLAGQHGFSPVIVCNSASTAAALASDGSAVSVGANVGFAGAAMLVAKAVEFETLVLCNDDLCFTDAAMRALHAAVEHINRRRRAMIMGFLPKDRPRIAPLPRVLGVMALVSGLSAATRRHQEKLAQHSHILDRSSRDGDIQPLPHWLGFPFVCVAINRGAWNKLGGFDVRFPLYFEDLDLLKRAHESKTVEVSVATGDCTHLFSATGRAELPYIVPLMSTGARNYLQLHCRLRRTFAAILVTIGLLIRAACWLPLRSNRGQEMRGIIRALRATWSSYPAPMPPWF
jgi:GT2 family glycosyltransferase